MDLNRFEEFRKRVEKKMNELEAKMSFVNDSVKNMALSFTDFKDEMTDFMVFSAESFLDHENRLRAVEKKLGGKS